MSLDPRTIAADIMCGNARSITPGEVWAHIGQAYDTTEIDATIADDVADLIAKTGIDLIWPDGTKNTELDAARVEIDRLTAELAALRSSDQPAWDGPARHVLAVTEPGAWTLRHPPTCPMDCPMFALMHAALATADLPVGTYEVHPNGLWDRALIGDRIDLHVTGADR